MTPLMHLVNYSVENCMTLALSVRIAGSSRAGPVRRQAHPPCSLRYVRSSLSRKLFCAWACP